VECRSAGAPVNQDPISRGTPVLCISSGVTPLPKCETCLLADCQVFGLIGDTAQRSHGPIPLLKIYTVWIGPRTLQRELAPFGKHQEITVRFAYGSGFSKTAWMKV